MERSKRAVLMELELLAVVCEKTADIRGCLQEGSPELGLLESALTSAHQGTAFADSVRGLHNYFITCGDVRGLYGFVREGTYDCEPYSRGLRPAGVPRTRPGERVYVCPMGRCARYWLPERETPIPGCALSGEQLRLDRI